MSKSTKTLVKPARLTNNMREAFVAAVMADVPTIDYEQQIRDVVNKAYAAALPAPIKKVLADPECAAFVLEVSVTLRHTEGLPTGKYVSFRLHAPNHDWLKNIAVNAAKPLLVQWCAQEDRLLALRQSLATAAYATNTTTQLAEAFPEFAKYLPQTEAEGTRNLPALANIVTKFVEAGWPKGKRA